MLDVLIRGGRVVTPDGVGEWDVAIQGERIVAVAAPGALTGDVARVIDASGKIVIPGGIDPHVHTSWPVPGGILNAPPSHVSRAALYGGTTTLVDFAVWQPGSTIADGIAQKQQVYRDSHCDYALHVLLRGAVPPEVLEQIPETISAGFPSFKTFTTGITRTRVDHLMVDTGHIWAIMEQVARHGGISMIHGEDHDLVMYMYAKLEREGKTGFENMPLVHSSMSEDLSFRRIIRLARHVEGAAVYLPHVSAKTGVDAIAEARAEGYPIYGETLPNYACFNSDAYLRPNGQIYHTYPSLKSEEDRQRLWSGLCDGALSTLATDESCTPWAVKVQGKTVFDVVGGQVGVETRMAVAYTEGVRKLGMSLERFVAVTSTNAAKIVGLYPRKGVIAPGSDADIVIINPDARKTLRAEDLHGSDYTVWEGWEMLGWPEITMLRGEVAVEGGAFKGTAGRGQPILCKVMDAVRSGPAA